MDILETANDFKNKLNESRINIIEALNDNQKQLYDLFFKVIGVPNIIVISAVSNNYLRNILHSVFCLKFFYLVIIYSYLNSLGCDIYFARPYKSCYRVLNEYINV